MHQQLWFCKNMFHLQHFKLCYSVVIKVRPFDLLGKHLHFLRKASRSALFKRGSTRNSSVLICNFSFFSNYFLKFLFQPLNLFIQPKVGIFIMRELGLSGFQVSICLVQLFFQPLPLLWFIPILNLQSVLVLLQCIKSNVSYRQAFLQPWNNLSVVLVFSLQFVELQTHHISFTKSLFQILYGYGILSIGYPKLVDKGLHILLLAINILIAFLQGIMFYCPTLKLCVNVGHHQDVRIGHEEVKFQVAKRGMDCQSYQILGSNCMWCFKKHQSKLEKSTHG